MAILTRAKAFLASPVTQQVVNDIYSGRVVYSVATYRSILADNYKPRAIEIYDPLNAPFLNHYRSEIVSNIASVVVTKKKLLQASCSQVSRLLWICQLYFANLHFSSVYLKSVLASSKKHESLPFVDRDNTQITTWELVFIIFGSAFALGEYTSSSEHGWISESCFYFWHPVFKTTLSLHRERMFFIDRNAVLFSVDPFSDMECLRLFLCCRLHRLPNLAN